ncbi:peptidase M23 [Cycloclasticus sp. 44_32_T64]|nr:peptidase M23 [Cycloclasticus sp. 44_32_T64]
MLNRRLICSILMLLLLLCSTPLVASAESEKKQQLALLRARVQSVEKSIASTQQSKTKEEQALKQLDKKLSESSKKLRFLKAKLVNANKKIKELQAEQGALKQGIKEQKSLLAEQLKSAYLMGKQQRVKMLLNQQQPDRMSRVMQYYDYFNQARMDNVKVLETDIQQLLSVEEQLMSKRREFASFVAAKKAENKTLVVAKKQRKSILAQLSKKIKSSAEELAELKENEKRLTNLLASIRQAIIDIPVLAQKNKPFKSLKGKLSWPIKGHLRKRFGSARKSGRYDGVVINASEGTGIRSISHGRVVYADWLRGYGLLIIVDHGSNYMSLYAFNEGLYKEVGDWVETGETIAAVGVSGGQQKAGLYFSIRKNGKPVNPIHWCRAVKKGRVG